MKELTIEEKAKAYDEAWERARLVLQERGNEPDGASILFELFPELKESEDERIRKALIEYFNEQCDMSDWNGVYGYQVVAWLKRQGGQKETLCDKCRKRTALGRCALEKQGEQKPAWSEEDERNLNDAILFIETGTYSLDKDNLINWLKSLKERVQPQPSKEWSEDDENRINRLIAYFEDKESFTAEDDIVYANWFKSLKDRYTWKPSDSQMEALEHFIIHHNGSTNYAKDLEELRIQLKKLKDEK